MSGIPLQSGIIYGPILSRRLGRSLGINLMPSNVKTCSFDCIYCQYGRTRNLVNKVQRKKVPTVQEVSIAVEQALSKPRTIDFLTFSGNGESTIHPDFDDIIFAVKTIKDKLRPNVKLALLSNGSEVRNPDVLEAIKWIDAPMMKLDAGDENTFQRINQPVEPIKLRDILVGLKALPNLMVQCMLIDGEVSNIHGQVYEVWAERLVELNPSIIHIYSSDRPTASKSSKNVLPEKLRLIQADLQKRFGLNVEAFSNE